MTLPDAAPPATLPENVAEQVEIQVKYQGYIDRQQEEINNRRDIETLRLPAEIDYAKVKGLSAEVQQKTQRPQARNRGAGEPHFGGNARCGRAVDGASETWV